MATRRRHLMKGSTVKITFLVCFSSYFFFLFNARGSVEFKLFFSTFFTLHFFCYILCVSFFKSSTFFKKIKEGKMRYFKDFFFKAIRLSCVENCIQIDGRYFSGSYGMSDLIKCCITNYLGCVNVKRAVLFIKIGNLNSFFLVFPEFEVGLRLNAKNSVKVS